MRVKKIRVKNFRNIEECDIDFSDGVNLLYGNNAQGKTNIVEAIYLFSRGKSFRAREEKELIKSSDDGSEPIISEKEIRDIVCLQTKIPINDINGEDTEALRELQERLESAIIGQQSAIESVSWAIKRGRLGIKASNRPCASLFFLGPTGVGKTELAKQVAKCVFGSCEALIRFDMSEYSEKHSISKLIGAPAGYVGYEDEGRLSKAIRSP